jgi:hypothetical protein
LKRIALCKATMSLVNPIEGLEALMRSWMKVLMIAACVLTLGGAATVAVGNDSLDWRIKQVDIVREIAFRDEMQVFDNGRPAKNSLYFLSIGDGQDHPADPPDELMAKFTGKNPIYELASSCEVKQNYVDDSKTLQKGTLFWVSDVWWMGDKMADVDCGYYGGGLISDKQTKRFVYEHGKWSSLDSPSPEERGPG